MPSRRLDDRIRQLCTRIAAAGAGGSSTQEVGLLLQELRTAIRQKVQRVRIIAANKLLHGKDADKGERRTGT